MTQTKHIYLGLALLSLTGLVALSGCHRASAPGAPTAKAAQPSARKYQCPMHPGYVSGRPGDCPICNMSLVPAAAEGATESGSHAAVPGRITLTLSPEKQQMVGLTTEVVERRVLSRVIRTTAVFEHDETRLARIAPRFSGWAGRLKINFTGQPVAKGEPLLSVYSPDLLSAESEYLLALRRFRQVGGTGTTVESEPAERLVESARRKLRLWQIDEEEIRELERRGEPSEEICLRSPISGHVVGKNVVEGKSFMAGETLYEIADLSHLWLRASVSENDLSLVRIGQRARIILPCLENAVYFSMVTFLYPHIDPQTRRAEIRLEVDNPNHDLRPDMWANVELEASFGSRLALPASAVIDTGLRYVAFVKKDDQRLEPREIKVGIKTDDYYEVLQGADAGESVVTRALFLVDSESQLKSVVAGMTTPGSEPQ